MGTTAEKLNYLKETKTEIKNALETPSNIFRDYPSLIKKYIDNQPTKVVSDGVCGNAVDLPIKAINIEGNSEQETTDGRQLFDNTLKGYGRYGTIAKTIHTGVRLSVDTDVTNSDYIWGIYAIMNLSDYVGKTVRMKAIIKVNSNLKGTYSIGLCNSNGTNRALKDNTSTSGKEISFVVPNLETGQEYLGVWFYANAGGTGVAGDYVDYTNVIITIDNEDMTYEPYTGGTPSPNPEYPQEIEVIEGFEEGNQYGLPHGCIGLEQSGKNLINLKESINRTDSGVTITCDEERQVIHFKGTISNTYCTSGLLLLPETISSGIFRVNFKSNCDAFIVFKSNDGTWLRSIQSSNNVQIDISSLSKPVTGLQFGIEHFASGDTVDFEVGYQLTKGSEPTPYEPYHSPKVYPINLAGNSLAKVGDVKDILKVNRNGEVEIKKNTWEETINGSYLITLSNNNKGLVFTTSKKKVTGEGTNNYLVTNAQRNRTLNDGTVYQNSLNFVFVGSPTDTLETIKAKFNGGKILYQLATPQIITLPSISPIELWQGTNIFKLITNLDTTFEVEYVVNKDSVLNEVQTAMLEAEIEI